jgi:hypothetical protein
MEATMKNNKNEVKIKMKNDLSFTCGICGKECEKQISFGVYISVCISCLKEAVALFNISSTINTFGTYNIHGIEYFNIKTNKWEYSTIKDLKLIALIGSNGNDIGQWQSGHCLKIILGKEQEDADKNITEIFNNSRENLNPEFYFPIRLYLCGEDNIKIPVLCSEGNKKTRERKYNEETSCLENEYDEETSCFFAYLPAMTIDSKFDQNKYNHSVFDYAKN